MSDEHLLIGSVAFVEKMECKAERNGHLRSETGEITMILRWVREIPSDRINAKSETETGVALHHSLINRLEVLGAIARLPDTQRWCIIHHHWEGKSDAEIARYYEMSEEAVRRARSRAYTNLKRAIYDPVPISA